MIDFDTPDVVYWGIAPISEVNDRQGEVQRVSSLSPNSLGALFVVGGKPRTSGIEGGTLYAVERRGEDLILIQTPSNYDPQENGPDPIRRCKLYKGAN